MHKITVIPGDGIGPEITVSVQKILSAARAPVSWDVCPAGAAALESTGNPLPEKTLDSIRQNRVALKGPLTTQVGTGYRSINVTLRQTFDLYCNLRPALSLPGIITPFPMVDLVIFRENTEDLYAGIEHAIGSTAAESIKLITLDASLRIARAAFSYAAAHQRKKVTAVHKANIMKLSDGLFLTAARQIAEEYPDIHYDEVIVDNLCLQLVTRPNQYDILLAPNLYGDIISDLCAGLVGGLGVVPGANLGTNHAIFEAVHGTAPDIAGKNIANPTALLMASISMLRHLNEAAIADNIHQALLSVLKAGQDTTPDIGGNGTTEKMTHAIIAQLSA